MAIETMLAVDEIPVSWPNTVGTVRRMYEILDDYSPWWDNPESDIAEYSSGDSWIYCHKWQPCLDCFVKGDRMPDYRKCEDHKIDPKSYEIEYI